jgi:hypothetical protein
MYGVSANKKIRIQISLHFDLSKSWEIYTAESGSLSLTHGH